MAVTAMYGFEAQAAATDNLVALSGTAAYNTNASFVRTGAASIRCNPASGASGTFQVILSSAWYHWGLYVASLPSVQRVIAGTAGGYALRLETTGAISVYKSGGVLIGTSATTLSTGGYYWIGSRWGAFTDVCLQINGRDEVTGTQDSAFGGVIGAAGTEASAIDIYIDDVIVDNAGFLAASKVDTLLPISDNTVTAVTDANGATTNLWQAVDNTPPAGVASANEAANPKASIKYPASATESYIANLETYSTAGILPGDLVLAVQSVIRHGEDIATGTKNGTLGAVTNPTISDSLAFTFGNDAGAHGAEVGLWKAMFGTLTTSPSVTLGTSPTLAVTRASETRVGCVDFMGLLVAWTIGSGFSKPRVVLQAVNRAGSY